MSDTFDRVKAVVIKQLGVEADIVALDSSFIGDLRADSLDTVELIMALEEEFDIEIPDEDAENIKTVRDVVSYIDSHK
jgi:acyl carrier protein